MTLNIKLPVDAVMKARQVYWDSDSNMGLAIIAALEKMVEIGMAWTARGTDFNGKVMAQNWPFDATGTEYPALITRLDAGEPTT